MMIAEPRDLSGAGESELARHIASCAECKQVAFALDASLQRFARLVARRSARRIAAVAALPIAAAILVIVAVAPHSQLRRRPVVLLQSLRPASVVSVDVAPGQRAAVLKTADPTVTLVWLTEDDEK
jgi:hypothetical protein